ncbi:50S ribosomal protein L15 [bacterium (Candidatus Gribaldobacteria) CG_4_10_14_0_2_um_filter_41_16]|uniref:Large ribosomal subunit protein uL15 n=4 Tax=Candidatus Gribaldobacteria TaxID=2798536 RepID=A0A2M7VI89_9BACT|nr:MAG: 50S ribosomal protein L15 [Parcubacteria group bacterium CG1_02_41_26]PIR91836.1 MAG: 50S ribosomal protein L15 [bacterium (Candidatus Gribaldobacteria) CG10_big_fil_rev_8_21_14_0_10_41_12]PIV46967.1 MAG: 50S ribosomal protein L15 [bacterium (Candidatus Gribaldobacteria) CG02_land_8_20_14_3_00_41_15]PIX03297.1 MAG: 50S ribosomal protein L15 [bacterium (Candidatus Gribaldobacteria) CG_4_8_14_3_um_filter_42_11]PJA01558.1 MAG: 50S ribosomal protein L15 [bacterium (Candidatus Gribaldobacter
MQLHNLQPNTKNKKRKRIGRGGKKGTYSGHGIKGQSSRAGRKMQPSIRELIKRYPKLRGYRYIRFGTGVAEVNIGMLDKNFQNNDLVAPKILIEKGLVNLFKGKAPIVKILGQGEITKKLNISGCEISKIAKEKIEKARGTIK